MDRTKNIPCLYFWIFGCWENKHTENTSWTIKKYPLDFLPLTCDINPCCCSCCWMVFLPWLCFWPCGVWTMCVLCVCCVYSVGVTARILISWGNWPIFIKNNGDKLFWAAVTKPSAEFPPVAALVAEDKGRHRLVGWPGLNLVIGTVPLVALPALKQGRLCSLKKKKAIVEKTSNFS